MLEINRLHEYNQAQIYAYRQLEIDCVQEVAYRQLMLALVLSGQRNEALRKYEHCRQIIRQELDIEPEPETTALYEKIKSDRQNLDMSESHTVYRKDLGQNRRGLIKVLPKGAELIRPYHLYFTSYATGRWQIWQLETLSNALYPVQFEPHQAVLMLHQYVPALSHDGNKIAFAAGSTNMSRRYCRNLYIGNRDGTNIQKLTHSQLDEYHPNWHPSGEWITYHAGLARLSDDAGINYGVWVTNIKTGETCQLTNQMDYDPVWSPDGRYIAYHSASICDGVVYDAKQLRWKIKVLDFHTYRSSINSCRTWNAVEFVTRVSSAGWLDEHHLVFAAATLQNIGEKCREKWDLYQIPFHPDHPCSNPIKLTDNGWDNVYPSVSSDGNLLLWQAYPHMSGEEGETTEKLSTLYVMKLDALEPQETPLLTGVGNIRDGFLWCKA